MFREFLGKDGVLYFHQLDKLERSFDLAFGKNINLIFEPKSDDLDVFLSQLTAFAKAITEDIDKLAAVGAQAVQTEVVRRAEAAEMTPLWVAGEKRTWTDEETGEQKSFQGERVTRPSTQLDLAFQDVIRELRGTVTRSPGSGTAGFGVKSVLDNIRYVRQESQVMDDTGRTKSWNFSSDSDFNIVWQMVEFGTGAKALPRKRTMGHSKVPGGNGAWFLNPNKRGPTIIGQEGVHFLFGRRGDAEEFRSDTDAALRAISDRLYKLLPSDENK